MKQWEIIWIKYNKWLCILIDEGKVHDQIFKHGLKPSFIDETFQLVWKIF